MTLIDFTNPTDDDSGSGPGGPPGGPPGPGSPGGTPPMTQMTQPVDDVTEMLIDYNERYKTARPTLFRDELLAQMMSVLIGMLKPNPLLVGSAGVGKTKVVEDLARRIAVGDPAVPPQLRKSTVYELPLSVLVAGAGIVGELEQRLGSIVEFASDPKNDAILFIDEIHLLQNSNDPTYKKVAQILKPALARGDMRVIGATTLQESRSFDGDPAFKRRFNRLVVDELDLEQTIKILGIAKGALLKHHNNKVFVSDNLLRTTAVIADESSRADEHRPDNALTLLDRVMADAVMGHSAAIAQATAAQDQSAVSTLQAIAQIPLSESKIRSVAMRLATGLAKKIDFNKEALAAELARLKGQDAVLDKLLGALERDDLGAFARKRPTAWMLAGPSGAGKSEAAKIIAQELTGEPPIILNMGEYHTEWDTSKIIGSPPGYVGSESNREMPFDVLETNPYRVIMLDEIEKADKAVHRLFLTALADGWMQMASGKVVDFSKALVIATTNAAKETTSTKTLGFATRAKPAPMRQQELVTALQKHFEPEFLGRFSEMVAFAPIDATTYTEILVDTYQRERERLLLKKPALGNRTPTTIDPALLQNTVSDTYLADQGARPAEAAARRLIEDALLASAPKATTPSTSNSTSAGLDDEGPQADGSGEDLVEEEPQHLTDDTDIVQED